MGHGSRGTFAELFAPRTGSVDSEDEESEIDVEDPSGSSGSYYEDWEHREGGAWWWNQRKAEDEDASTDTSTASTMRTVVPKTRLGLNVEERPRSPAPPARDVRPPPPAPMEDKDPLEAFVTAGMRIRRWEDREERPQPPAPPAKVVRPWLPAPEEESLKPFGVRRLKAETSAATSSTSPSSAVISGRRERSRSPITESYMVRRPQVNQALRQLGVKDPPVIDCFAQEGLHVWPRWWGPGSREEVDAFRKNWDFERQGLLWWNPPFSRMKDVVDKIQRDGARGVLICPYWPQEEWHQRVLELSRRRWMWRRGTEVFETVDGPIGPTRWGVWALLVDGRLPPQRNRPRQEDLSRQSTGASRRRERKKKQGPKGGR